VSTPLCFEVINIRGADDGKTKAAAAAPICVSAPNLSSQPPTAAAAADHVSLFSTHTHTHDDGALYVYTQPERERDGEDRRRSRTHIF
jgi:hypothetical protein